MNNDLKSFGLSFIFHGAILSSLLSLGTLLPGTDLPTVIDFSLMERSGAPQAQRAPSPPALTTPPSLAPPQQPPPTPLVKKISAPVPAAELVAKQESEPTPAPLPEQPVMTENSRAEKVEAAPAEVVRETITAAAPDPGAENRDQAAATSATGSLAPGFLKERYVKMNLHQIKENIQKTLTYPRIARQMGWQGRVIVRFMVDEEGRVQDAQIVESSGFAALDRNAILTIRRAAPFPCPPIRAELVVPVIYRLA